MDTQIGKLLHDYEMGWLTTDDQERFELHLMDCRHCFEEAQKFRQAAKLLSEDDKIKSIIADSVNQAEGIAGFWSKLKELFWPKTNIFLKPALVYLGILLLMPIAYRGIVLQLSTENQIRPVDKIDLVATRGSHLIVRPKANNDLLLNFAFDVAVPGQYYRVVLKSDHAGVIYESDRIRFDMLQSAQLILPNAMLSDDEYLLIIEDPTDSSLMGTDTLMFRIEQ
jgi:hypothetical protein